MTKISLVSLALFCMTAFAQQIQTAEYYQLEGWPGEYPAGFQILSDVEVETVREPNNPVAGGSCTLKKDIVIHPWAQKTVSEFTYLSPISRFTAKKDFPVYKDENSNIEVKKGDEIIQLSYLAEGFCRVSVNGEIGEESCFGEEDERAEMVSKSAFGEQSYFRTTCAEGGQAWINATSLSSLITDEEPQVKYAEVLDFGTVEEP